MRQSANLTHRAYLARLTAHSSLAHSSYPIPHSSHVTGHTSYPIHSYILIHTSYQMHYLANAPIAQTSYLIARTSSRIPPNTLIAHTSYPIPHNSYIIDLPHPYPPLHIPHLPHSPDSPGCLASPHLTSGQLNSTQLIDRLTESPGERPRQSPTPPSYR